MAFTSTTETLDVSVAGVATKAIDVTTATMIAFDAHAKSGMPEDCVVSLQVSLDNTVFHDYYRFRGVDKPMQFEHFAFGYIKFCVTSAEKSSATIDIVVNGK